MTLSSDADVFSTTYRWYYGRNHHHHHLLTSIMYQAEQLTFLGVLLSVIVLGNSMVLVALLSSKARKSRMNFFIMHLAAAGKVQFTDPWDGKVSYVLKKCIATTGKVQLPSHGMVKFLLSSKIQDEILYHPFSRCR